VVGQSRDDAPNGGSGGKPSSRLAVQQLLLTAQLLVVFDLPQRLLDSLTHLLVKVGNPKALVALEPFLEETAETWEKLAKMCERDLHS
jgi:hypothetical protein